jgi:hypothetical protein
MDNKRRCELEQQLADAEYKAFRGRILIERQCMLLQKHREQGHDVRLLLELLATMEETQRLHEQHRDRLRQALAEGHE